MIVDGKGDLVELKPREEKKIKKNNLFWATVGGMGLTGAIFEATISLKRLIPLI